MTIWKFALNWKYLDVKINCRRYTCYQLQEMFGDLGFKSRWRQNISPSLTFLQTLILKKKIWFWCVGWCCGMETGTCQLRLKYVNVKKALNILAWGSILINYKLYPKKSLTVSMHEEKSFVTKYLFKSSIDICIFYGTQGLLCSSP